MKNKGFTLILILLFSILSGCSSEWGGSPDGLEVKPYVRPDRVKMSAVGDLMVHSRQANDALRKGDGTYDYNYSFSYIKKYFEGSDIVAGNLETVFGGPEIGYSDYPTFSVTDEFGYALKNAGFNVLTTSNNHSMDKREKALLRTIDVLDELEIIHFGTYNSSESRDETCIVDVNGIRFAFLSYTYGTNGIPVPKPYLVNLLDMELIRGDIARAKEHNPDFIIIFPHMGNEYESFTRQVFKDTVYAMFEAGADIVLASHPHVVQPAEYVQVPDGEGGFRTCFVTYSMGNFVSGQRTKPREAGVIYNLYFEKWPGEKAELKEVSFTPTWVKFYDMNDNFDIAVLPVYDYLISYLNGETLSLRKKDITRMIEVQEETTKTITGEAIPLENLAKEYFINNPYKDE